MPKTRKISENEPEAGGRVIGIPLSPGPEPPAADENAPGQPFNNTKDEVNQGLYSVFRAALEKGQFAPAVRALELLGKELGMFREKGSGPEEDFDIMTGIERHEDR